MLRMQKGNNKWVCVVCNRRQSVLCVHASSYCAADQRRFVQDISLGLGLAGCRGSARRAPEGEADGLVRVPR